MDMDGTVWDLWARLAEQSPESEAILHWSAGQPPFRWLRGDLLRASGNYAEYLERLGVRKGDVCALIIRHRKDFYPIYMAVCALGALPAVLAYPNQRLHPDKFRQGLEGMARKSGLHWVLTERELESITSPLLLGKESTIRGIFFPLEWSEGATEFPGRVRNTEVRPGDPCLLQHSSGTTGLQKAVVLSHRAILEHVHLYGRSIGLNPGDRIVSWLPLYHDMGLIAAFHLPLAAGIPVVQLDPFEWVTAPVIFLDAVSRERGTLGWLPNFAYNLMADRIRDDDLDGIRLDSIRMLINCSEPVRAESHDRFYGRFAPYGFRRNALAACYAMAETTFAATQTPPGSEANRLTVARDAIGKDVVRTPEPQEDARICTSSGAPIPGCEMRIVDDSGVDLPAGRLGEIAIRSVSLFDGYRNNPERTAEVLRDGWCFTGDYGFSHEGEYYVIGRKKDIIIVAGKNVYPEDIEDAVGQVPGILPGRVIAFGIEDRGSGTEQVGVVAETSHPEDQEKKKLRREVVRAGMQIDVTISRVYLAPPRWLIKSSSGKPARRANMDRAVSGLDWR